MTHWLWKWLMGERIRVTGDFPPLHYLEKYPNWENALDEEDVEGQDETTLRPAKIQNIITTDTTFTAGDLTSSNGRKFLAILEVRFFSGQLDGVTAFRDSEPLWYVFYSRVEKKWITCMAGQLPKIVPVQDMSIFPLTIKSRLPREITGKPHHIVVQADGSSEDFG